MMGKSDTRHILDRRRDGSRSIQAEKRLVSNYIPGSVCNDNAGRADELKGCHSACYTKWRLWESAYMLRHPHGSWPREKFYSVMPQHAEQPRQRKCHWVALDFQTQRNQGQRDREWPCNVGSKAAFFGPRTSCGKYFSHRSSNTSDCRWRKIITKIEAEAVDMPRPLLRRTTQTVASTTAATIGRWEAKTLVGLIREHTVVYYTDIWPGGLIIWTADSVK